MPPSGKECSRSEPAPESNMPLRLLSLALAAAAVLTAATPLMWLDPVATDREATFESGLLGVWSETGGRDLLIFRRNGDSAYTITFVSGSIVFKLEARLFRSGEARFLDVRPPAEPLRIPLHFLVRIWTEAGAFRFADLDTDWFRERAAESLVLTAPAAAIRDVLAKYGADDRAHSDDITRMERVPPAPLEKTWPPTQKLDRLD
jgi:hypothetical protein